MIPDHSVRPDRTQWRLIIAAAVAYAVGYPVALVAGSPTGWVLVSLGGLLLLALGIVTIRRIQPGPPNDPTGAPEGPETATLVDPERDQRRTAGEAG